jgi:hypothetical protein
MKNILGFIFTAALILVADYAHAACSLNSSVYRDVGGRGFELNFSQKPVNSATIAATVTLTHSKRGRIFEFDLVQSQGYGSTWLVHREDNDRSHLVNFFNSELIQTSVFRAKSSSMYLFISGLGSEDYYRNQMSGSREIVLGDVMWKFYRCR